MEAVLQHSTGSFGHNNDHNNKKPDSPIKKCAKDLNNTSPRRTFRGSVDI